MNWAAVTAGDGGPRTSIDNTGSDRLAASQEESAARDTIKVITFLKFGWMYVTVTGFEQGVTTVCV